MRIIKFIGLKVLEIGSCLGIFYLFGKWDFLDLKLVGFFAILLGGLVNLIMMFAVFVMIGMIGLGLFALIKKNWEWAGK